MNNFIELQIQNNIKVRKDFVQFCAFPSLWFKKSILVLLLFSFYNKPSFSQILKRPIPDKLVVLTFDDGVQSHYSCVAPLLKQYGFRATFFVCEFPPDFTDTTKYMTWLQMKALDQMGFEVANHTHTHRHVNNLSKSAFKKELKYIEQKFDSLKMQPTVSFAYPGYDTDSAALEVLKKKGYHWARAGGYRVYNPLKDHPYLIPSYTTLADNKEEVMAAFKEAKDGNIVVLTVHGVPDVAHEWVSIAPQLLIKYLDFLKQNNYTVIALKDLSNYIYYKKAFKKVVPDFTKKLK